MLSDFAVNDYAKGKISDMEPYINELQLKQALNETDGARKIINCCGNPHIPNVSEVKTMIDIIEKEGLVYPVQLGKFQYFIASCRRLKNYLKKSENTDCSLAYNGMNIDTLDEVYDEINRCIRGDEIDSEASKELSDIRRQIANINTKIKSSLDDLLKSKKKYCNDSFISVKNGHYTLPVKKEYKNQILGSVIATSSTGTTYFIEPSAILKLTEKLEILKTDESIEKDKILYSLSALIYKYKEMTFRNIEIIESLDFAFAKGKLSTEMKAVSPNINTQRYMKISEGRHPLLNRDICVPLDFEIGNGINGIVITEPNTGGKTLALKLVGLFSVMAQCGLHIPCKSADICMNGNVLCDIGDGQNISENLSTFSAHIKNVVNILENTSKESLVLLDELGSGTDPAEGMGIAVAILEELKKRNCLFIATTHYAEVKSYAENAEKVINARMTFDRETLEPQYKLIIGEAGESCAFYIAERLGFPRHLLKYAAEQSGNYNSTLKNGNQTADFSDTENEITENVNSIPKIQKIKDKKTVSAHAMSFSIGDSVMVYPDKKIGIIFKTTDDKGILGIQINGRKKMIKHNRVKLKVPASKLYPPDYDFSIVFDTVENRKARHKMNKYHCPNLEIKYNDMKEE